MSSEPSMEERSQEPTPSDQGAPASGAPGEPPIPPGLKERPSAKPSLPAAAEGPDSPPWLDWQALLRNRFILGGLAVVIVLLLTAVVLLLVGNGDENGGQPPVVAVNTPEGEATISPRSGFVGRIRTTAPVRSGPDTAYEGLGTVRGGSVLSVVGRNEDQTWFQVIYPPGSQLRGWVNAAFIEVAGDVSRLAIAGPSAPPSVALPTGVFPVATVFTPPALTPEEPTPTERPERTRTRRPRPTLTRRPTRTPTETSTPEVVETPPTPPTETPPAQPGAQPPPETPAP